MSNTLLEVKNLKKYFPVPSGTLHAVDDVSFSLNKGETLGVVGESGCGKSTLGKTILRLTNPTSGEVIYNGQDIASIPDKDFVKLRPELQMIFQDPMSSLNPRMSVKEQIEEPLLIYKKYPDRAEREKKPPKVPKKNAFTDFESQHSYDFDALKEVLGVPAGGVT